VRAWSVAGCEGWSHDDLLPSFKRLEGPIRWARRRGTGGAGSDADDLPVLREGVRLARRIAAEEPFASRRGREREPGQAIDSDDACCSARSSNERGAAVQRTDGREGSLMPARR
jgi:hypothetical protein